MSLYNALFGVRPATFFILPMLGKHPDEYPRFRDCFTSDEEHPRYDGHIHVYTRVGGGNRDDYEAEIDRMRESPHYVTDFDDSFDSTFATFVFRIPDQWKPDFDAIAGGKLHEVSEAYQRRVREVFPKLADKLDNLWPATATPAGRLRVAACEYAYGATP